MTSLRKSLYTLRKYSTDIIHFLQTIFSPLSIHIRKLAQNLCLITVVLAVSYLPLNALSAEGVIATGDFKTGDFSQWRNVQGDERVSIETDIVRQGNYSAKFVVTDGDQYNQTAGERASVSTLVELVSHNGPHVRDGEGDEFYYAWSTFFPEHFPDVVNWTPIFTSWHSEQGGTRAPVTFRIRPATNEIIVQLAGGVCQSTNCGGLTDNHVILDNASRGVWHDFVMYAKWTCSNNGVIEVWHKYENEESYDKVLSMHNIPTLQASDYWAGGNCMELYKKQGIYRSADEKGKHVIYHDGYTQGTSFEAVAKHAHNTVATLNEKPSPPSNLEVVNIASEGVDTTSGIILQDGWRLVSVDSEEVVAEDGHGINAFDGDSSTFWHTEWKDRDPPPPHEIQIDLGAVYTLEGFRYLPRQDGSDNGRIKKYAFYVSNDPSSWGHPIATGALANSAAEQTVRFNTPATGRYIRLVALSEAKGNPWTSMAELKVVGSILNQ